jgi:four helix bundle protein
MYVYSFEKLDAWQNARELVVIIYRVLKNLPADEKFGMISQMRRAGISVCSNLAEGCGRNSKKQQRYFYGIAYSSLMELLNQFIICHDLLWLSEKIAAEVRPKIEMLSYKINALVKSLNTEE